MAIRKSSIKVNPMKIVVRELYVERDLEDAIEALRKAAEGLVNPRIEIDHDPGSEELGYYYTGCSYRLVIRGLVKKSEAEIEAERNLIYERLVAQEDHQRQEYERLRKKFGNE